MKIRDFLIFGLIWHLEGFGSMENTPTGCGSVLPTILRILKNDPESCNTHIYNFHISKSLNLDFSNFRVGGGDN